MRRAMLSAMILASLVLAGSLAAAATGSTSSTLDLHVTTGESGLSGHLTADVRGGLQANVTFGNGGATANVRIMVGPATVTLDKESGKPLHVGVDGLSLSPAQGAPVTNYRLLAARTTLARPATGVFDSLGSFGSAVFGEIALWLQTMVPFLLLGWLLMLLIPNLGNNVRAAAMRSPWQRLGIGFVALVAAPSAAVALFVGGIFLGVWWLGLMLLGVYAVALAWGYTFTALIVGRALSDRLGWTRLNTFWSLLGGLAVISLLTLIPYFGAFVGLLAVTYGMGALALAPRTPPAASLPPALLRQWHFPTLSARNRGSTPAALNS